MHICTDLYAGGMTDAPDRGLRERWSLRHLRCLIAISEEGSLTDAAIRLGLSQAQVSRTLQALETAWGVQLVRRMSREAVLTAAGRRAVTQGRDLLQLADRIEQEARGRPTLRLGYAWAAAGRHTSALQRLWHREEAPAELTLVRRHGALAGLGEGLVDAAIVRREPPSPRFAATLIGTERRVTAFPDDHPWVEQSRIRMADFAGVPLIVDSRAGTTTPELWPASQRPHRAAEVDSVDGWLDAITAGRGVGVSTEATSHHHQRAGVRYRLIEDAPPVGVYLAWHRGDSIPGLERLREALTSLYGLSGEVEETCLPSSGAQWNR